MPDPYDYDVALSYAGEDAERAKQLAFALKRRGVTVFYDKDEAARLWGENLYTHLTDIYQNRAHYCVALLSRHYAAKPWTLRELAAAQARAFTQQAAYLLPVRLDDSVIPGVLPTEAFVSWDGDSSDTISELVLARLHGQPATAMPARRSLERIKWADLTADYLETFDMADAASDTPQTLTRAYAEVWLPKTDEAFESTITGGTYRLENRLRERAVRYVFVALGERDMAESPVSVEVKVRPGETLSGAGLIYRLNRASRYYYAYVSDGKNQFRLYCRDTRGFRTLYAGRHTPVASDAFIRLGLAGSGASIGLYINDVLLKTVVDESLATGDTGIIGLGKGLFEFDNFTIYR